MVESRRSRKHSWHAVWPGTTTGPTAAILPSKGSTCIHVVPAASALSFHSASLGDLVAARGREDEARGRRAFVPLEAPDAAGAAGLEQPSGQLSCRSGSEHVDVDAAEARMKLRHRSPAPVGGRQELGASPGAGGGVRGRRGGEKVVRPQQRERMLDRRTYRLAELGDDVVDRARSVE